MKIKKENIPVKMEAPGSIMRIQPDFGGMTVGFDEFPAGTDLAPLLEGLENDSCHCPHWGYVLEGSLKMIYDDGTTEVLEAGDVFYMQPGHTGVVQEDIKMIDFSPDKEMGEVLDHVMKKMKEMGG